MTTLQYFVKAQSIFTSEVQDKEVMCEILNVYSPPTSSKHNCLGCNFNNLTEQIAIALEMICSYSDVDSKKELMFSLYIQQINILYESMRDIFNIVGLPEIYREKNFPKFIWARKWANFFKHPKAFTWMVHHPTFVFENTYLKRNSSSYSLEIDYKFIGKYYSGGEENKSKALVDNLRNRGNNVVVILPDLENLTIGICAEINLFVEILIKNRIYQEILEESSTIEAYFQNPSVD